MAKRAVQVYKLALFAIWATVLNLSADGNSCFCSFLGNIVAPLTQYFNQHYLPVCLAIINIRFTVNCKIFSHVAKQYPVRLWHPILLHTYLWMNLTILIWLVESSDTYSVNRPTLSSRVCWHYVLCWLLTVSTWLAVLTCLTVSTWHTMQYELKVFLT